MTFCDEIFAHRQITSILKTEKAERVVVVMMTSVTSAWDCTFFYLSLCCCHAHNSFLIIWPWGIIWRERRQYILSIGRHSNKIRYYLQTTTQSYSDSSQAVNERRALFYYIVPPRQGRRRSRPYAHHKYNCDWKSFNDYELHLSVSLDMAYHHPCRHRISSPSDC